MSRRGAFASAMAAAVAFAILLVAVPHHAAIVLGRLGDGPFITGFGPRLTHRGLPGRWTSGLGLVDLPATPFEARVTLHLQPTESRPGEPVELFLNGARVLRATLPAGRQTLAIVVPGCAALAGCRAPRLALQSPAWVDTATGERRGVFVARVAIDRGGPGGASVLAWGSAILLALGVVATAFSITAGVPVAAAIAAWAFAALWVFRIPLSPWWPWLALAAAAAGISCHMFRRITGRIGSNIGSNIGSRLGSRIRVPPTVGFTLWAAALIAVLFVEVVTRGEVFGQPQMLDPYYPWRASLPEAWEPRPGSPFGDVPMLVYPFLAFARERLLAGDLPLWTASLNAGQPFLGAYQAAVFSPLTWAALAVPLPQATVVIAFLRLLIGGIGAFVFVRGLGLSLGAAGVAGTAYLLNPFTLVWLEHPPGGVPPFLPWMLHAATLTAEGRRFAAPALAVTTALVLLGGHPHTGAFCVLFGSAWAAAAALAQPARWRRLAVVGVALVLGAALTAIQVLPFFEYLFASRGYAWRQFDGLNRFAAPLSTAIAALVPRFLGEHAADTYAGRLNFFEQTMYAGIPVLVLAAVGVAAPRRDWRALFFAGTGLLAALAVYGAPGVLHVISSLPLLKSAALTRLPIVAIASAIVVAAFGVDALRATAPDAVRRRLLWAAAGAGAVIAVSILVSLSVGRSFLLRTLLMADTWRWSLWALLLALAAAGVIAAFARRQVSRAAAVAALTTLVALDLFVFGRGLHPTHPAERIYPGIPELARVRDDAGPFRVVGAKGALMPNSALVYGLQDIRAYDGLGLAAYMDLLDVALAWAPASQQHELHDAGSPVLDLLNVRYLLAPPDVAVDPGHWVRVPGTTLPLYRNLREQARAFLVDGYVVAFGDDARRQLRDGAIDLRRAVVLDRPPAAAEAPEPASSAAAVGAARITTYQHERVAIDTDAPGRRLLVLSDTWFPGWRATIDGAEVPIARANYAFRAVSVPAGRHRVVFEYAPASFRVGAAISGAALAAVLLWIAAARRRRADQPKAA